MRLHDIITDVRIAPGADKVPFEPIAWADDLVCCIDDEDQHNVVTKIGQAVDIIERCFSRVGLSLNFAKCKTEATLRFSGVGARSAREKLLVHNKATIAVPPDGCAAPEVLQKIAVASSALTALRRSILANKGLFTTAKVTIVEAVVLNKLFFGAQARPALPQGKTRKLIAFYHKAVRAATGLLSNQHEHIPNSTALAVARLPPLEWQLRRKRLIYLPKLLAEAPKFVVQLMLNEDRYCKDSWLHIVHQDAQCLRQYSPDELHNLPEACSWQQLFTFVTSQSRVWRRAVDKAILGVLTRAQIVHDVRCWQDQTAPSLERLASP